MTFKKHDVGWTIRRFVVKWCPQQIDSPTGNLRPRKMFVFLFFSSLGYCETIYDSVSRVWYRKTMKFFRKYSATALRKTRLKAAIELSESTRL